jgi:hypothetical protein
VGPKANFSCEKPHRFEWSRIAQEIGPPVAELGSHPGSRLPIMEPTVYGRDPDVPELADRVISRFHLD